MFGNSLTGVSYTWALHSFFAALLLIGIVLLIIWMAKNLKKGELMGWAIILLVVGLLGAVLTMRSSMLGWKYMMDSDEVENMMDWTE